MALCGADLLKYHPGIRPQRKPRIPLSGTPESKHTAKPEGLCENHLGPTAEPEGLCEDHCSPSRAHLGQREGIDVDFL